MSHVTQNAESDDSGKETRRRVHDASDDGVFNTIVFEFVIRSQSRKCARADAVSEKYLSSAVDPRLGIEQFFPIRSNVLPHANGSSFQSDGSEEEDREDEVREQRRKPNDLSG